MKNVWMVFLAVAALSACGGGGGGSGVSGSAPSSINAAEYKLPSALPSVPDQAGKN